MESSNYHILLPNTAPGLKLFFILKPNYMNKELIMKSDVLDILFENRNKTYGAYILRKFYGDRLKKALGIIMTVAIVFSALTFLIKKETILNARIFEIPETKLPTNR